MKIPKMLSGLRKSTKITVYICGVFLIITTLVLLILMIFPIQKTETPALEINQPRQTAPPETTAQTTDALHFPAQTEAPHTLSTWSASIEGHTRSTDEYFEYMNSTYEPLETMWHELITDPPETEPEPETLPPETDETDIWTEETTTFFEESTEFSDTGSDIETGFGSETVTETVTLPSPPLPPESDPVPTEPIPTEPVQTEPAPTDPPVVDLPPADPEIPAEGF